MRTLWVGAALLAGTATAAWGQIAAPSIAPGTFSSENPAAVKWGAPSRIGAAYLGGHTTDSPGNTRTDYTGGSGGFRLVGETFALAGEGSGLRDQKDNFYDAQNTASAALAVQTGTSLAWGLGYNSSKRTVNAVKSESREPAFGVSLQLREIWFVGAAVGRESAWQKDAVNPATDFSGDRDVTRAGIGLRRGGTVLVHLEAFAVSKRDFETKAGKSGGEETTGGTAEFTFGSLLLGGSARHTDFHKSIGKQDHTDLTTADLGWAPRVGLAITLHYESTRVQYIQQPPVPAPPVPPLLKQRIERGALVATYQF